LFVQIIISQDVCKYVLWFNFILGLNFIFLCFWIWLCFSIIMSLKQSKIKSEPRIYWTKTYALQTCFLIYDQRPTPLHEQFFWTCNMLHISIPLTCEQFSLTTATDCLYWKNFLQAFHSPLPTDTKTNFIFYKGLAPKSKGNSLPQEDHI